MTKSFTWIDGNWFSGNPPIMGSMTQSTWLGSLVFDGARRVNGKFPDLDLHCERLLKSAKSMGLVSPKTSSEVYTLCIEGSNKFTNNEDLYIKPMIWAEDGLGIIAPDPNSSRIAICVFEASLPNSPMTACLSDYIRPMSNAAPTDAKAAALYANTGRAMRDANNRGFDNCVICDHEGYVAEFTVANLFMVKDNTIFTPKPTGTFLSGITRNRVINLLSNVHIEVIESKIKPEELIDADEIFCTGNYVKIRSLSKYETTNFIKKTKFELAHRIYWDWVKSI